ncbi:MAG: tRNA (adenosine(37)-N6)-threonylcarbamoyltransferase complex dimerization subunit type 1 TsaB [Thermodesulfobacteriota bacterium]
MKVLAIETSTMAGSVALVDDDELVSEYLLNIDITHSERLLLAIDCVMRDTMISMGEIDGFAISIGPGSFTGLRIGASTVKGLAYAVNKPVVGIPTLDAMAENISFTGYLICPILDARKKQVYTALYKRDAKNRLKKITPDLAINPGELLKKIQEKVVFLGDGIKVYHTLIKEVLKDMAFFAPLNLRLPRAASVARLSLYQFKKNNVLDLNTFTPSYVRPSEAEEKFKEL